MDTLDTLSLSLSLSLKEALDFSPFALQGTKIAKSYALACRQR